VQVALLSRLTENLAGAPVGIVLLSALVLATISTADPILGTACGSNASFSRLRYHRWMLHICEKQHDFVKARKGFVS
jgi:hypothetical protein